jgi:hypothetical protein
MIIPDVWKGYIVKESTVQTSFWTSGILTDMTDQLMPQMGGTTVNMPFFNDLANDEAIIDETDIIVDKVGTGQDVSTILERVKAYGGTDLAADLSGADPMPVIIGRLGAYWGRQMQKVLLSLTAGTMGSPSMSQNVYDITGLANGAGVFDGQAFIQAKYRLGDRASDLSCVAVHSDTMRLMEEQDLIDFIPPSEGGDPIPFYMGKRVIVNDVMPVDGSGNYTSYLFGPGAVGYAEGAVPTPVEPWRDPLKAGGYTAIINRRKFALHIRGIKWVGTPAGPTASNAELANPANWQRVYDPKLIKIVAFKHKNA